MDSGIFGAMGLSIDPAILFIILFILVIAEFVVLMVFLSKYGKIRTSYEFFMQGRKGRDLEEEIMQLFNDIAVLKSVTEKNKKDIRNIIINLKDTYQKVGIVKYDAFKEMGGKLSFSIALLNDNKTGFILNSVHSSEGCYVYTKEIVEGECSVSLGDEEKKALTLALQEEYESRE